MDTFDDLMDRVDELFGMNDVQTLPEKYLRQIEEDPYSRWFTYDVTWNHLRYYQDYKRYDIEFMDNTGGPRWALYPDVMAIIDELVDDGRIVEVDSDYKMNPMWIDSESVGLVCEFEMYFPYIADPKLEYLDMGMYGGTRYDPHDESDDSDRHSIEFAESDDSDRQFDESDSFYWYPKFNDSLFPRLRHIHILIYDSAEGNLLIGGPTIKYLSIGRVDPVDSEDSEDLDIRLLISDVTLYYVNYSIFRISFADHTILDLLSEDTRYCDTSLPYTLLNLVLTSAPQLNHIGLQYNGHYDEGSFTNSDIVRGMDLGRLTSLSLSLSYFDIYDIERVFGGLVYLELRLSDEIMSLYTFNQLEHLRVLHLSFPSIDGDRWNVPDTCDVLSLYSDSADVDRIEFEDLKYLMVKYHSDFDESWILPALSEGTSVSVVDYPYDPSSIPRSSEYTVVWRSNNDLSVGRLTELLKDPRNDYNTDVFLKREILRYIEMSLE